MILRTVIFVAVALGLALAIYVRLAPMPADVWAVDPDTATRTGKPNDFVIGPDGDQPPLVTDLPPDEVTTRLRTALEAMPRTTLLAEGPVPGAFTYLQRSALMGYPDAISVKVSPEGSGSRVVVYSRSRFGQSDLGVNAARVRTLLEDADLGA